MTDQEKSCARILRARSTIEDKGDHESIEKKE